MLINHVQGFFTRLPTVISQLFFLWCVLHVLLSPLLIPASILAQDSGILPGETLEEDKIRPTKVTASVVDNEDPSVPVLVEPTNNSFHQSNDITFIWKESTDNTLLSYYRLILDGDTYFTNIPLTDTTNDDYTLSYDSDTGQYSLTPTEGLDDGSYTWQVEAYDIHGNSSKSVTWVFTIDSQAPFFTVTQIEDQEVYISTLDADSVPTTPILLANNQPALAGSGEVGSEVTLTINLPGENSTVVEFEVGSDGNWSVVLPKLPRDVVVWLDFLIIDQTGNVSVIEDVPLILRTPTITIPIPPFVPSPLLPDEPIEIPFPPIDEIIPPIDEILPPIETVTPPFVIDLAEGMSATVQEFSVNAWPIVLAGLGLLALLLLPLLKIGAFVQVYQHQVDFGANLLRQVVWIIGLDGWWEPQSMVASYPLQEAVDHTVVKARGTDESQRSVVKDVISDRHGYLPKFDLTSGWYRISVLDERGYFPVLNHAPRHLDWQRFYTGEGFQVLAETQQEPWLVIPVGRMKRLKENRSIRRKLLSIKTFQWPMGSLLVGIVIWQWSIVNVVALIIYGVGMGSQWWVRRRSRRIDILTPQQQPIQNCICIAHSPTGSVHDIAQTDQTGRAQLKAAKTDLILETISWKYHQTSGDLTTQTIVSQNKDYEVVLLSPVEEA
ncbi:MAG: Ig-like domain-containing protein [Patescibacteria group bacterium]